MCVCAHACTMACMQELALSLHHVGPRITLKLQDTHWAISLAPQMPPPFFLTKQQKQTNKQTNSYPETEPDAARPAAVAGPVCCRHKGEKEQLEMCMVKNT